MVIVFLVNGYWFYFNDNDIEIVVYGFVWLGWEMVYVNDNLVFDKCELFKFFSNYEFIYNGFNYWVNYYLINVLMGLFECLFYCDNKLLVL